MAGEASSPKRSDKTAALLRGLLQRFVGKTMCDKLPNSDSDDGSFELCFGTWRYNFQGSNSNFPMPRRCLTTVKQCRCDTMGAPKVNTLDKNEHDVIQRFSKPVPKVPPLLFQHEALV
jgi:hypothetical protein